MRFWAQLAHRRSTCEESNILLDKHSDVGSEWVNVPHLTRLCDFYPDLIHLIAV